MLRRTVRIVAVMAAFLAAGSGGAWAAGYDSNQGKPPDNGNCIGFFSNGGAQAGFIQGVRSSGGPGAVGESGSAFGTSGGNGSAATSNCA